MLPTLWTADYSPFFGVATTPELAKGTMQETNQKRRTPPLNHVSSRQKNRSLTLSRHVFFKLLISFQFTPPLPCFLYCLYIFRIKSEPKPSSKKSPSTPYRHLNPNSKNSNALCVAKKPEQAIEGVSLRNS